MAAPRRGWWRATALVGALVLAGCSGGGRPAAAPAAGSGPAGAAGAPAAGSGQASAPAVAQAPALQALVAGAKQEGQLNLVWSENSLGGPEGARRWAEGFNRLYGLGLNVRFTPGPSMPEVGSRITQEYQAGRPASSDVFLGTEVHLALMIEAGSLTPIDWAAWSPYVQNPALVAPGGVAVAINSVLPGITYNTSKVRGDAVPRSLQDLLKPAYKGRVASTPYAAQLDQLAMSEQWGEERTLAYVRRLAEQVTGLIRCGEGERLVNGEFDILAMDCGSFMARRWHARGAPLEHLTMTDAALLQHWYMSVPRRAAHPNAAKL